MLKNNKVVENTTGRHKLKPSGILTALYRGRNNTLTKRILCGAMKSPFKGVKL
jgi:hypothetical protein